MFSLSCVIAQLTLFFVDFSQLDIDSVFCFLLVVLRVCRCPPPPLAMLSLGATGTHSQASQSRVLCCRLQANQAKVTFLPIISSADNQNYDCIRVFGHTEVILHNCVSGRLHLKHKITEPVPDPTTKQDSSRLFLPFDL